MTQTTSRFFDGISELMIDSAAIAEGVRAEFEALIMTRLQGALSSLDVVSRQEFDAVWELARKARCEVVALQERVALLEASELSSVSSGRSADIPCGDGDEMKKEGLEEK
ncbi:MAG: accessory factor UbiK family protein [Alphaproteobacteria bacterium]|nr:accessory factor UbiK family protein [Alphaproteobacteria bacterium]